jgi:purine-binding chemotaxis protein CheW
MLLLAFRLGEQRYGLPLQAVERVLPMVAIAPLPQAPRIVLGMVNFHGEVVPVVDVRRRLDLPPREYGLDSWLLVVRTSRRVLALPVDAVEGVVPVTPDRVTSSSAFFPGIAHVAGIVSLDDGLLFIHDPEAFLSLDEERHLAAALEGPAS